MTVCSGILEGSEEETEASNVGIILWSQKIKIKK